MAKLALLVVSLTVLLHPSFQLTCYECRSDIYKSTLDFVNTLPVCAENLDTSNQTRTSPQTSFLKCKKLVERLTENGREKAHIIRTIDIADMGLNTTYFEEYTCDVNLCNGGITASAAVLVTLLAPLASAAFYNL